jgi:hypothetical protein
MHNIPPLQWLMPLWLSVSCFAPAVKEQNAVYNPAPLQGSVLIELFTSEGCSSCPPADRLLEKIAAENNDNVYVLSFHVDYWNYIGRKDPFSQARFSQRQRNYARQFSLESIYTPQMVVNGVAEFVGSDEQKLRNAIAKNSTLLPILMEVTRKDNITLSLTCNLQSSEPQLLQLALVQKKAITSVKRGENSGKTLAHVNVVQQLETIDSMNGTGTIELKLPPGLKETDYLLFAFTQNKKNLHITGAVQMAVPPEKEKTF